MKSTECANRFSKGRRRGKPLRSDYRIGGSAIAELAASLAIVIPVIVAVLYSATQVAQGYLIYSGLSRASELAARNLAIAYEQNPTETVDNFQAIYGQIKVPNIVNSVEQFQPPVWQTGNNPPTVRVVCAYRSGQYGCPVFPNPDLGGIGKMVFLSADATCRIEK